MTRTSRALWYLLALTPLVAFAGGISASISARSADESLGQLFVALPFELATVLLAIIVLISTLLSHSVPRELRVALFTLCAAVVPMLVLIMVTAGTFSWPTPASWKLWAVVLLLPHGVWLLLLTRLRRKIHRACGQPSLAVTKMDTL